MVSMLASSGVMVSVLASSGVTVSVLASSGVMVSVLASSAIDQDYKICICCFSAKHTALRRKRI